MIETVKNKQAAAIPKPLVYTLFKDPDRKREMRQEWSIVFVARFVFVAYRILMRFRKGCLYPTVVEYRD
jgi:hypothetical protein